MLALLGTLLAVTVAQDTYRGREIARTMHYAGAPWLIRESREREEECSTLLEVLDVKPGDVVCDIGCGNGFYTLPLAELVGENGKVLAVDIQPQMLKLLEQRAKQTVVADRIETILGTPTDPKLPEGKVDLVLLVDVYHEFSDPEPMLAAIRRSLSPRGRVALVEFRTEDPKVPIKPEHKMSKRQILKELPPNGLRLVDQFDRLPWQHVMFFARATSPERRVLDGLRRAADFVRTLAVHGGYAGIYSLDLTERYGEALYEKATATEIWIQPPGTPSVGSVLLRAFRLTGDDDYFEVARAAGLALAWAQRRSGGFDHRADLKDFDPDASPVRAAGPGTFDDDISQGALTFLIELDDVVEEPWLTAAIERGLMHLLEAQFENGAWPQWYPLRGGYHDHYTFNDNAINDCIRVALLASRVYDRGELGRAAVRGGDFIIASQLAPQAGWAQQYSKDLRPARARAFEPAAVCTAVTARNLRTLFELFHETGEERFLAPIPAAIAWLVSSRLDDGSWARFYEIESDRPIYGDRDGEVHYSIDEISEERRSGYAWHGTWGIPQLIRDARRLERIGAERLRAERRPRGRSSRDVGDILDSLDAKGRWVREGRIHIGDFVRNANRLCDAIDR